MAILGFLLIGFLIIGICLFFLTILPDTNQIKEIHKELPTLANGYDSSDRFIEENNNFFLGINSKEKHFFIAVNDSKYFRQSINYDKYVIFRKKFKYSQLRGIEILEDDITISKMSINNQIVKASIGSLIGGSTGAIIGGLTGNNTLSKETKSITLRIVVNDPSRPNYDLKFLDMKKPIDKNSSTYKTAYNNTIKWHSIFSNILKENEKTTVKDLESINDLSEQLSKLNDLKNINVITEEEFEKLKKRIIN